MPPPPSDAERRAKEAATAATVTALVVGQARAYKQIEDSLLAAIDKLMGQLFNRWYFQDEVDEVVDDLVDVVRDAQEAVADLTQMYMDEINDALEIRPKRSARDVQLPKRLRKIDPKTEWNRPAREARVARLLGADEFIANDKARKRAEQQARMDLAKAAQEAERQRWGVSDDIIGYRRIIHPELPGEVCGLCVVAATRIYSKSELKALHGGCRCTVLPVLKDGAGVISDPGFDLNRDDLDTIYDEAGGNTREDLRKINVSIIDHGELGPILVDDRYKNRTTPEPKKTKAPKLDPQRIYDIQKKIVDDYERKVREGTTPQFDIEYHRRQVARLAKELGLAA